MQALLPAINAQPGELRTVAEVAALNERGGQYFFSRDTMRFFGDSMASFAVRERSGRLFLERVRAARRAPAGSVRVGQVRPIDPVTGAVGLPLAGEALDAYHALARKDSAVHALATALRDLNSERGRGEVLAVEPDADAMAGVFVRKPYGCKVERRRYRLDSKGRVYACGSSRTLPGGLLPRP